jgi:RNA polymerase sigma factor (sigma-70 family)
MVTPPPDLVLLREFSDQRSEQAFATLVHRYLDLVHSAATRLTSNRHLSEEVVQAVFLALAQQAPRVAKKVNQGMPLSAWLHVTTRNLAAKLVRTEVRRQAREQATNAMRPDPDIHGSNSPEWDRIAAHLDQGLGELSESDRSVVFLRYFDGKTAREIGAQLGIAEDAAQKRVLRALDRLRSHLSRLAPGLSSSTLASLLGAWAVQKAPPALAATIAQTTWHGLGTATSVSMVHGFQQACVHAVMTKSQTIATGVVVAAMALPIAYQAKEIHTLRGRVPPITPIYAESGARLATDPAVAGVNANLAQGASANAETVEIARLRARADELRKAIADRRNTPETTEPRIPETAGPLLLRPGQLVAVTNLVAAGTDSPEAAAQTLLAHMRDGNVDATLALLLLSPEQRTELESEILKEASTRDTLAERMQSEINSVLSVELLGVETLSERRSAVSLQRITSDATNTLRLVFGRTSSGWRQVQ